MKIIRAHDAHDVALHAYALFKEQLNTKPNSVLGLATGSSPILLYKELIEGVKRNECSFKEVITFNLDEYMGMDATHPQSYAHFMREQLFNHIDIDLSNTHIPQGLSDDYQVECDRYNHALKEHIIDIQLLGVGSNGHIGFNEPLTPFDSVTHVVKLKESTRRDNAIFFDSLDDVPTHAISMGINNIMQAKKIVLLAIGPKKADAIYNIVHGPVNESCPGSILQTHPDVTLILDPKAAARLD